MIRKSSKSVKVIQICSLDKLRKTLQSQANKPDAKQRQANNMKPTPSPPLPISPNFQFLAAEHPLLVRNAALAERYLFEDPATSLIKLRQFAEMLAREALAC